MTVSSVCGGGVNARQLLECVVACSARGSGREGVVAEGNVWREPTVVQTPARLRRRVPGRKAEAGESGLTGGGTWLTLDPTVTQAKD